MALYKIFQQLKVILTTSMMALERTFCLFSSRRTRSAAKQSYGGQQCHGVLLNAFMSSIEEILVSSHIEDRQGGSIK